MIVGIPKETKTDEYRVALLPVGVELLSLDGHTVLVEKEAGLGSGFSDQQYSAVGAQIVQTAEEIYSRAEMIVKVKEPQPDEMALLDEGRAAAINLRDHRIVNDAVSGVYPDLSNG